MKTTEEIAELLELAAYQGRRALRIEQQLGKDPDAALRIAKATMRSALRSLEERYPVRIPAGMKR